MRHTATTQTEVAHICSLLLTETEKGKDKEAEKANRPHLYDMCKPLRLITLSLEECVALSPAWMSWVFGRCLRLQQQDWHSPHGVGRGDVDHKAEASAQPGMEDLAGCCKAAGSAVTEHHRSCGAEQQGAVLAQPELKLPDRDR